LEWITTTMGCEPTRIALARLSASEELSWNLDICNDSGSSAADFDDHLTRFLDTNAERIRAVAKRLDAQVEFLVSDSEHPSVGSLSFSAALLKRIAASSAGVGIGFFGGQQE